MRRADQVVRSRSGRLTDRGPERLVPFINLERAAPDPHDGDKSCLLLFVHPVDKAAHFTFGTIQLAGHDDNCSHLVCTDMFHAVPPGPLRSQWIRSAGATLISRK